MVKWICSVKISGQYSKKKLRKKLELRRIQEHIKLYHFRWFDHLTWMNDECWPKIMLNYNIAGAYPRSCLKKEWLGNINNDMKTLKINTLLAFNWHKWQRKTQIRHIYWRFLTLFKSFAACQKLPMVRISDRDQHQKKNFMIIIIRRDRKTCSKVRYIYWI